MTNLANHSVDSLLAVHVIAAAEDAIITVNNHAQITSWNPGAERLFGYWACDAIGQSLALIIPEAHRSAHMAGFHEALDRDHLEHGGQPARVEGTTSSGKIIPLVMSLGLLQADGGVPVGVVAILRKGTNPISFI